MAWLARRSNCTGQGPGCSGLYANMLTPSDMYASDECQGLLNNVTKDEYPNNYEIYNYYDTCYATSGMMMTEKQRRAHLEYLRNGGEFGAAVHVGQAPLTEGGALNDYSCGGMSSMGKPHIHRWHQIIGTVIYGHLAPGGLRCPKTPRILTDTLCVQVCGWRSRR